MTRNENGTRHNSTESSSAESWRSQDTIKASKGGRVRGTPVRVKPPNEQTIDKESEVSPGSTPSSQPSRSRPMPPWENSRALDFGNYRKDLAVLDASGGKVPSIRQQPPTAISNISPWVSNNGSNVMPSSVFSGSFYNNDSSEDVSQLSPGFRPNPARDDSAAFTGDDRRPSVASATTVSSSGSRTSISRSFHKKLQGFFGEEYPGSESRQGSDASLSQSNPPDPRMRNRNNSMNNTIASSAGSRPASPASSRPRTPLPSSEVTPWEFQDFKDVPAISDNSRFPSDTASVKSSKTSHKLHLPTHKHKNSKEDGKSDIGHGYGSRPAVSRDDSASSMRRNEYQLPSGMSSAFSSKTTLIPRPSSPTPSTHSTMSRDTMPRSPGPNSNAAKRSNGLLGLGRFMKRGEKNERTPPESLRDLPMSSVSLQQSVRSGKTIRPEPGPPVPRKKGVPDGANNQRPYSSAGKDARRDHGRGLPFKSGKRGYVQEPAPPPGKDPNDARVDEVGNAALWNLDTDLSHMEGIINTQGSQTTPPADGGIFTGWPGDEEWSGPKEVAQPEKNAAWDAPDSWGVRRPADDNIGRLAGTDENGEVLREENAGPPHFVRIFRVDSTFAVLSVPLTTTVSEIIQILGKKTFAQDDLDNYHIVMRKGDTSRELEPGERPLAIQKRLLEQAGYTEADRLEEVGREDNSYLCRFTFLPAKLTGYSSLEKDPGFNKLQKFSHVDLQGRNLVTIPITLYQKATEIISINLSRNLSLDVPKDFIQACSNLRDIKYTSNDAWKLPPSISLATRLTMLDVSNNRLEQLDHAELHKLQSLQGLRLSNNKLTSLPKYFGSYKALRSLNLSSNSLTEFPDFMCEVRTLVDLDISFNSITCLPKIGQLECLERLWATNNKLTGSFPDTLRNLVNLREVDVRFNAIDNIDIMAQLPRLEYLAIGHNSISAFEGAFAKLKVLQMNHNPVTRFGITAPIPSLSILNLASAKLVQLPDDLFSRVTGLTKLILDKNHFAAISPQIGRLVRLEHLSIARNSLDFIPGEIGRLVELRYLDVRENNLGKLPAEIWYARKLETLNVSSNVLESFPKPPSQTLAISEPANLDGTTPATTPGLSSSPSYEELGKLEDFATRRPSQASGYVSMASSPASSQRAGSIASTTYAASTRKPSMPARVNTTEGAGTPVSRKDSSLSNRIATTFAGSLRHLFLADNRLEGEVFDELALLPELRIVNLSYNLIYDIPPRSIRRWQHLTELYLSGNDLTSLPAEDLEDVASLKVLHINNNKFQVLPAELGKVAKLAVLDAGSNSLKYNVSNWPYDWNWNWNHNLRYLNLSGNKRLEIKRSLNSSAIAREGKDLTDFTSLVNLRILGLMDVTLMVPSVPDQTEDRRVRTSGSTVGTMAYGMADSLGRNDHVSIMDMVIPRFRSHDDETLLGMFDGAVLSSGGSKVAKYLYDNFKHRFSDELERLRPNETAGDALRRTYLGLNKDLALIATQSSESKATTGPMVHRGSISTPEFADDDLNSGSVATVLFLKEMELFVSNVGDAQALLIQSDSGHRIITRKHDPAEMTERARIREAGGFVSRQGKLNDVLEVSRAFGYVQMSPSVIAAPHVTHITLRESDEIILIASKELWDYLTPDFAVDVARSERNDLMRAAQKLRDLAIAFGATGKIMVMMIGVSDLRSRQRNMRGRANVRSLDPSGSPDDYFTRRNVKRGKDIVADSKLARLDQEVEAPTGDVSLVFTDIKNSTLLWETYPIAMRSAIRMHNEVMRRHLRIIGGYEVKTEGDAFMVAFPTVTSALLWCFTIQSQLLEVPWPQEILNSVNGQEVLDADGNVIFRGLSVRMGIHWGSPVCEVDPVTKRMDYFGPMVNRASRISSVADGGQITVSSDFIAEIQRLLETHIETDRTGSTGSEDTLNDDLMSQAIRRELRSLSSQGFEVKDLGERRLKGLENPEYIYLMYPHSLASRLIVQQQRAAAAAEQAQQADGPSAVIKSQDSDFIIDTDNVWDLWNVSLRLEMLCSTLECPESTALKPPETALLERMKNRGGEITDRFLINFVEHQISRIETCVTTLALRNMVRPFKNGMLNQACGMQDILSDLGSQLAELQRLKAATGSP